MHAYKTAALALACLGLTISQTGYAADAEGWQFEVTPYLLAAGLDGTVGVQGHTTEIDMSFGDIWDLLDAGFMAQFTARKGPWTLGLEGFYVKLADERTASVTGPGGIVQVGGQLDVSNKMYVYQGTVAYRVLDQRTRLNLLGAVRYTQLEADVNVTVAFPGPVFGGAASASGDEGWTDFVVGAHAIHPVSDQVALVGYADVGAGGSDLTYQLIAGVNWEFRKDVTAKAGYRYLYWDYADGGTVWDMAVSGLYLGLGIRF